LGRQCQVWVEIGAVYNGSCKPQPCYKQKDNYGTAVGLAYCWAAKANFGWRLGPFIMSPVNHSPAINYNTTKPIVAYPILYLTPLCPPHYTITQEVYKLWRVTYGYVVNKPQQGQHGVMGIGYMEN